MTMVYITHHIKFVITYEEPNMNLTQLIINISEWKKVQVPVELKKINFFPHCKRLGP